MSNIKLRTNRQTKTTIEIVQISRGHWETRCFGTKDNPHNGICEHTSRKLAESFAAVPIEWCEECMRENYSDLDIVE